MCLAPFIVVILTLTSSQYDELIHSFIGKMQTVFICNIDFQCFFLFLLCCLFIRWLFLKFKTLLVVMVNLNWNVNSLLIFAIWFDLILFCFIIIFMFLVVRLLNFMSLLLLLSNLKFCKIFYFLFIFIVIVIVIVFRNRKYFANH